MPLRVLHIVEEASPAGSPAALAWLATIARHTPGMEHRVVLLGGRRIAWAAGVAGLDAAVMRVVRVPVAWGRVGPLLTTVRPAVGRVMEGAPFHVVHAWSSGAAWAARVLWPRTPRVLTPVGRLDARSRRRVSWSCPSRFSIVAVPTRLATFDIIHIDPLREHDIDPPLLPIAIDPTTPTITPRDEVRRRWGLSDPNTRVVALLSDPPHAADAIAGLLVTLLVREVLKCEAGDGIAALMAGSRGHHHPAPPSRDAIAGVAAGADLRLLAHPLQLHRRRAEALADAVSDVRRVVQDPEAGAPWRVLAGCDVAIALGEPCAMSLVWARAVGVPVVVAADSPAAVGLDEHTAILAEDARPKRLAEALLRRFENEPHSRIVAAASRSALSTPASAVAAVASLHMETGA